MAKKILFSSIAVILCLILCFLISKTVSDKDGGKDKAGYNSSYKKMMEYSCDLWTKGVTYQEYISLFPPLMQPYLAEEFEGKSWEEVLAKSIHVGGKCTIENKSFLSKEEIKKKQNEYAIVLGEGNELLECITYDIYIDGEESYETTMCKFSSDNKWYLFGFGTLQHGNVRAR